MICPSLLKNFRLTSDLRDPKFSLDFYLYFGFEYTKAIRFCFIVYNFISVLPNVSQTYVSQESWYWTVPEFFMVRKIA